jgi:hypothetical protein
MSSSENPLPGGVAAIAAGVGSLKPPQPTLAPPALAPPMEGSCNKIENRLLPALSVRGSARSTQVERALRARFRL